jgi:hypothetical protein
MAMSNAQAAACQDAGAVRRLGASLSLHSIRNLVTFSILPAKIEAANPVFQVVFEPESSKIIDAIPENLPAIYSTTFGGSEIF